MCVACFISCMRSDNSQSCLNVARSPEKTNRERGERRERKKRQQLDEGTNLVRINLCSGNINVNDYSNTHFHNMAVTALRLRCVAGETFFAPSVFSDSHYNIFFAHERERFSDGNVIFFIALFLLMPQPSRLEMYKNNDNEKKMKLLFLLLSGSLSSSFVFF